MFQAASLRICSRKASISLDVPRISALVGISWPGDRSILKRSCVYVAQPIDHFWPMGQLCDHMVARELWLLRVGATWYASCLCSLHNPKGGRDDDSGR